MEKATGWELVAVVALIAIACGLAPGLRPKHQKTASTVRVQLADPCANVAGDHRDCYDKYFDDMVAASGPKAGLSRLSELSKANKAVEADCHPLVHEIGHAALKYYKNDVTRALEDANELCASGYYHGVLESYMAAFSDDQLKSQVPLICHSGAKKYSSSYFSCIHGLGHGLTIRFEMDIFKALPYCDLLHEDWEFQSCYGGVFMQNIVADLQPKYHKSVDLKPEDPIYPCNVVRANQKSQCYGMVSSYILRINNWDYSKGFATCDGVESDYVATCYQSMGRDISGAALLDPATIVANCSLGKADVRQNCFIGASKNAVYNDGNVKNANRLCVMVGDNYKSSCLMARDEIAASL